MVIEKYITEKLGQLSILDVDALMNNPIELEVFVKDHLYGDIFANNLKEAIIDEDDFYLRKVLLISVKSFLFKLKNDGLRNLVK